MSLDDDELDDREMPDPSDMDQDDYTVMSRCPGCRKMIDEQSELCPRCGYYITQEDERPSRSVSIIVVVVIGIALITLILRSWG